jgi:predicted O-methyltransferase YrrM
MTTSEAVWTAARAECPFPQYWHASDAYSTEDEVTVLVAAMVTALQPDFVVETGSCIGNTTEAIGHALKANGHGRLVSLEIDPAMQAGAQARCAGLPVSVLNVSSMDFTPTENVDFAFFDSDCKLRPLEFERYLPWMHSRTVVGFHDTGPQHPVRELLARLEASGLLVSPLYLPTPRGVCFSRVGI